MILQVEKPNDDQIDPRMRPAADVIELCDSKTYLEVSSTVRNAFEDFAVAMYWLLEQIDQIDFPIDGTIFALRELKQKAQDIALELATCDRIPSEVKTAIARVLAQGNTYSQQVEQKVQELGTFSPKNTQEMHQLTEGMIIITKRLREIKLLPSE